MFELLLNSFAHKQGCFLDIVLNFPVAHHGSAKPATVILQRIPGLGTWQYSTQLVGFVDDKMSNCRVWLLQLCVVLASRTATCSFGFVGDHGVNRLDLDRSSELPNLVITLTYWTHKACRIGFDVRVRFLEQLRHGCYGSSTSQSGRLITSLLGRVGHDAVSVTFTKIQMGGHWQFHHRHQKGSISSICCPLDIYYGWQTKYAHPPTEIGFLQASAPPYDQLAVYLVQGQTPALSGTNLISQSELIEWVMYTEISKLL